jgi:hypothetical protein
MIQSPAAISPNIVQLCHQGLAGGSLLTGCFGL